MRTRSHDHSAVLSQSSLNSKQTQDAAAVASKGRKKMSKSIDRSNLEGGAEDPATTNLDDEAPEEISLGVGKSTALKQQEVERSMRLQNKRLKSRIKQPQQDLKRVEEAIDKSNAHREETQDGFAPALQQHPLQQQEQQQLDLLPAAVIATLQEERGNGALTQVEIESQPRRAKRKKKVTERKVGTLLVKLLDETPQICPSESAKNFLEQRLHGDRLKRSVEMLQPQTKRQNRRFGAAVQFKTK